MSRKLTPRKYFRLPWSLADNGLSWLEVTTKCNLACKGCYRDPKKDGHKTLEQIAKELEVFKAKRKSDCMSIAGGDPLVHPQIVEIVRMIKKGGWKPILNTNGLALTEDLLLDLKDAGVFGFTFHIDTTQDRKDSPYSAEKDHNALREHFARLLAKVGGVTCSFNQTVSGNSLPQIKDVYNWAKQYPHIVHSIVFIIYRAPSMVPDYDFYANGKKIDMGEPYWDTLAWSGNKLLKAQDVVDTVREIDPDFEPCAYLNGTVDSDSMKWLLTLRMANGTKTFGYTSPRFMQIIQNMNHLLRDRWLSYASPLGTSLGKLALLAFAPFDSIMRKNALRYLLSVVKNPLQLFKRVYIQSFTIIQPVDFMKDGQLNMCDGCPDITVHNGELYWSCRLEEIKEYGAFVTAVPKGIRPEKVAPILDQPLETPTLN